MTGPKPMHVRAMLPYFGGKRTLAPRIIAEMGDHSAYWEGCFGSLAIIMAKPRAAMETVCDLYGHALNLARVLASPRHAELLERCGRTLMHEGLFHEAKALTPVHLDEVAPSVAEVEAQHVDTAYWFFCLSWMGRNGASGTGHGNLTPARRFTSNGGSGGYRWQNAVDSIPAWHERLRGVLFQQVDVAEFCERVEDKAGSVLYVDPPYLRKGTKYVHDFTSEDHRRLAAALAGKTRTRVLVSYYDEPELEGLYPGWTSVSLPVTKSLVQGSVNTQSRDGAVVAPEVLLINGPAISHATLFSR